MGWSPVRLAVAALAAVLLAYGLDRAERAVVRRVTTDGGATGVPRVLARCRMGRCWR